MGNTYHQMYIQAVFAVKYRAAVIQPEWKTRLFSVMGNLIKDTGCKCIIINGVEDHVHCFFGLKLSVSVSNVMQNTKAKSSKWLNESKLLENKFHWQDGFGAFSYSHSAIGNVFRYIQSQKLIIKNKNSWMNTLAFSNNMRLNMMNAIFFRN